jgi:hypothetical protein
MSRRCTLIPRCIKLATDTPPAILDATASPGLPLIGTRTQRLQNSRRSCARTILQESARKCAHSCILWSAIRQNTNSKKVPFLSIHRCHPPPSSLTATRHDFRRPIQPNKRYLCRYLQNRRRIFQGQSCIHARFAAGLNRFSSENRSHIDQRRAHGIRENVTAILLYPFSAGAFHCIGKPLTALTRYYKVRC